MAFLIKRVAASPSVATSHLLFQLRALSSPGFSTLPLQDKAPSVTDTLRLSPLLSGVDGKSSECPKFELLDDDSWRVVSGLADSCRVDNGKKTAPASNEEDHGVDNSLGSDETIPDYDDIEDMRVRGNLFYKIDKLSIDYEDSRYDFHRRKPRSNGKSRVEPRDGKMKGKSSLIDHGIMGETAKGGGRKPVASLPCPKLQKYPPTSLGDAVNSGQIGHELIGETTKGRERKTAALLPFHNVQKYPSTTLDDAGNSGQIGHALIGETAMDRGRKTAASLACHNLEKYPSTLLDNMGNSGLGVKKRTPTFNQLTAAYHEPFCLDIYVSKASVRASIIHRATSNVVVVAHSISKDMKFDLTSTKNKDACVAVGQVLARRALEDDIHNVVYTPRKGEKVEGKLKLVLQSVINGGVDVKLNEMALINWILGNACSFRSALFFVKSTKFTPRSMNLKWRSANIHW